MRGSADLKLFQSETCQAGEIFFLQNFGLWCHFWGIENSNTLYFHRDRQAAVRGNVSPNEGKVRTCLALKLW